MSFDWYNYFNLATFLKNLTSKDIDSSLNEARFRCAISRYYYAIFNLTKIEIHKKIGQNLQKYEEDFGSHMLYIKLLYSCTDNLVRNIGAELEELKEMREDSDYRLQDYKQIASDFKTTTESAFFLANGLKNDISMIDKPETQFNLSRFNISP